ncbi:TetR/AcrR family transcriptional regulator [Enterococcus thailandicus]|uniref:TetR/AcrR family transcriptional regulator n=1 Tax=Enterococcus thailandicus TaxID=417368 RepID=UPI0022E1A6C2|nr:TetR/AcrR family transcriptional regulator [Enterococcus thailandicus]
MSENKRILMTKRLLREGLLELLKTKELNQITIKDLCEFSQINRSTFYRHYNNIMEILEEYLKEIQRMIITCYQDISLGKNIQSSIFQVIEYIYFNKEQCFFFQKKEILTIFLNIINPMFYKNMDEISKYSKHSKIEQKYLPLILINATEIILSEWFNSDTKESPEEITSLILNVSKKISGVSK